MTVSLKAYSNSLFTLYLYTDVDSNANSAQMAGCGFLPRGSVITSEHKEWEEYAPAWGSIPAQLSEYFAGKRSVFNLSREQLQEMTGAKGFTSAVLHTLYQIPFGSTCTYGDLADRAGSPKAIRAAANAVATNPYPVIIPCHRILPKSGGIGNYALRSMGESGIPVKRFLLQLENSLKTLTHCSS